MIQSRIELFFKFISRFDLIDKEVLSLYYKKSQLINFNDKNLVELNCFINKAVQFDDFQTLVKLELVFQQRISKNKNFNVSEFNPILPIWLSLRKKLFFYFLELQLCALFLIIGLNFSNKRILLGKPIITFLCSNSRFSCFLSTKLVECNISINQFFPAHVREYQINVLNSYYLIKSLKKGE